MFQIRSDRRQETDVRPWKQWQFNYNQKMKQQLNEVFESIYSCCLLVYAEISKYDLTHLLFMTVTCKWDTYSLYCMSPSPQVFPTSTARCCLHPSCGSCQSRTLWHANCHGDMCVTASESLFIGSASRCQTSMVCLRQSTYKRATGIKNRHNTQSISGFILASVLFVTLWQ